MKNLELVDKARIALAPLSDNPFLASVSVKPLGSNMVVVYETGISEEMICRSSSLRASKESISKQMEEQGFTFIGVDWTNCIKDPEARALYFEG